MTDEQVKQNAEAYAKKIYPYTVGKAAAIRDFIAGVHSLDEEIEELQNELESLRKGFYEQGNKLKELIKKLMLANNKLRNPWISVEERLPCDEDYDDENIYCFLVRQECGYIYNCAFDGEEWLTNAPNGEEWGVYGVTHWMPIPDVPKV